MEPVATTEPESDALATIATTEQHIELGVLGADAPSEAELTGKDNQFRAGARAARYVACMLLACC